MKVLIAVGELHLFIHVLPAFLFSLQMNMNREVVRYTKYYSLESRKHVIVTKICSIRFYEKFFKSRLV